MSEIQDVEWLEKTFEEYDAEYSNFKAIPEERRLSKRPDLCAFLLLDKLAPETSGDIVCAAEHDKIYLEVDMEKLAVNATREDILTLVRCGVFIDQEDSGLVMFA